MNATARALLQRLEGQFEARANNWQALAATTRAMRLQAERQRDTAPDDLEADVRQVGALLASIPGAMGECSEILDTLSAITVAIAGDAEQPLQSLARPGNALTARAADGFVAALLDRAKQDRAG